MNTHNAIPVAGIESPDSPSEAAGPEESPRVAEDSASDCVAFEAGTPQAEPTPVVPPQQPSEVDQSTELVGNEPDMTSAVPAELDPAETLADLRQESSLIQRFQQDVEQAGLIGEKKNATVVFFAAVSAKLEKPLSVSVGGASAAGKNHLTGTVTRFIPDEDKKILTGMSPKVLMHSGEDEYRHKAVFIAEHEGVSGADYAIRTMQSEQRIEWEFVDRSKNDGIEKKKNVVNGPAAFIQTTTRVTLHPENETRLLFIQMDESEEQTRAINEHQAKEAELGTPPLPPSLYERWHALLRSLKPLRVRIPFAAQLAAYFPASRVRSRRDFPKLLGLIEVSACLYQHQRPRANDGSIVAVPQDYLIAKELFEHCYYAGPESKVGELVQAAERLAREDFSAADLIQQTGWRKTKLYEVLSRAEELGCIAKVEEKWGRYRFLRKHAEPPLNLPPEVRLTAEENFHFPTEGLPLTFRGKMENCPQAP